MDVTNTLNSQILSSFCSDAQGLPYWLFCVLREGSFRYYRRPQYVADWHSFAETIDPGDFEALLSIARKRPILY